GVTLSGHLVTLGGEAAMEPGLRDRGHARSSVMASSPVTPQWSPVFATGVTPWRRLAGGLDHARRNGARSSRPGSPAGLLHDAAAALLLPQWSPVFATGVTSPADAAGATMGGRNGARS